MTRPSAFPDIPSEQYAVAVAEFASGIVLNLNGKHAVGAEPRFRVFEVLGQAEAFCQETMSANAEVECWILDHNGEEVKTLRPPPRSPQVRKETRIPW